MTEITSLIRGIGAAFEGSATGMPLENTMLVEGETTGEEGPKLSTGLETDWGGIIIMD